MGSFIFGCRMGAWRANMDFSPREPVSWDLPREPAAGKASAFLRLEAISKTYSARDGKPVRALDEISCEIRLGEFISILGPSRYRPSPTGRDSRDHEHQTVRSTPCPPG